jgi:hypothetical protein
MDHLYKRRTWQAALGFDRSDTNDSQNSGSSYMELLQRVKSTIPSQLSVSDAPNSSKYPGEKRNSTHYKCEGTIEFAVEMLMRCWKRLPPYCKSKDRLLARNSWPV